MRKLILIGALVHLVGCSAVAPKLAKIASKYCDQPYEARMALRSQVNEMIAPNLAMIWCDGDPDYQSAPPAQ